MIFKGTYYHTIDEKNRLFLPAKLRRNKNRFIATPGFEKCIYIYPLNQWVRIMDRLNEMSLKDKSKQRMFRRVFLSNAVEVPVDNQGRIVIPQLLKSRSYIKKDVAVIGGGDHLEIWAKEKWQVYYSRSKKIFNQLATELDI